MKRLFHHRIIIIGADHHNTLAVIRCLGRKKCNISILVHSSLQKLNDIKISHSKYAKGKTQIISENTDDLIAWLKNNADDEKQIIFPCSDFAEYTIDSNYELLRENYILPGFKNAPGKCAFLMDKWNQYNFLAAKNIPTAKTWKVTKSEENSLSERKKIRLP